MIAPGRLGPGLRLTAAVALCVGWIAACGVRPARPPLARLPTLAGAAAQARVPAIVVPASALAALRAPSVPVRLSIPEIGVAARVQPTGVLASGALGVPDNWTDVAWYAAGPAPGQPGDAVIDGHLDSWTAGAVFWHLARLRPGDGVWVRLADGRRLRFEVRSVRQVAVGDAPLATLFSRAGPPRLTLITCGGTWIASRSRYADRVLVTAALSTGGGGATAAR